MAPYFRVAILSPSGHHALQLYDRAPEIAEKAQEGHYAPLACGQSFFDSLLWFSHTFARVLRVRYLSSWTLGDGIRTYAYQKQAG